MCIKVKRDKSAKKVDKFQAWLSAMPKNIGLQDILVVDIEGAEYFATEVEIKNGRLVIQTEDYA